MDSTNGFTDLDVYDLNIQNDLGFNSNFNSTNWTISEDPVNDTLDFDRNGSTVFSLDDGMATVSGDLTVNGNILGTTSIITENLAIQDNIIELGITNTTNSLNLGFHGQYFLGTTRYVGMLRDINDGFLKVVDTSTKPTNNNAFTTTELSNLKVGSLLYSQSTSQAVIFAESTTNNEAQLSLSNTAGSANVKLQATTGDLTLGTTTDNIFVNTTGLGINVRPTMSFDVSDSNVEMVLRSQDEDEETKLYLSTPFSGGGIEKTALIAKGIVDNSKNNLHFCLNQTSNNTEQVSIADSRMVLKNNGNLELGITNGTKNFEMNFTNASAMIRSKNENETSSLFFSTPFQNTGVAKSAIFAVGQTSFSQNDLHFCLNNNNDNNDEVDLTDSRMVIKKNGFIGMGTTTPSDPLTIVNSNTKNLLIQNTVSGNGSYMRIDKNSGSLQAGFGWDGNGLSSANDRVYVGSISNAPVGIYVNNSFVAQFTSNGLENSSTGNGNVIAGKVPYGQFTRATQSIPTGTTTVVDFNTTVKNRGTYTLSSTGITVPATGLYQVCFTVGWQVGTVGGIATIYYNGLTFAENGDSGNVLETINCSATVNVDNAGVKIEPRLTHTTGANANATCLIQLTRIGDSV